MSDTTTDTPRRKLSPEHLAKMAAGRTRAAAERKVQPKAPKKSYLKPEHRAVDPPVLTRDEMRHSRMENGTIELDGLTAEDCADECRDGFCVITGFNHCGHPHKGGIQAAHQMDPAIKRRYIRAKKLLKRLALDRQSE